MPASVSIITEDDIKKSSARTVGELLQDIPGVQVVNSGGQGLKRISLRGEGVNRTLILIDGQQIVENKSMDGTALMIDPNLIERIEVEKINNNRQHVKLIIYFNFKADIISKELTTIINHKGIIAE